MDFWETLDYLIAKRNKSRKEITKTLGIAENSFSLWSKRRTYPAADVMVKVAKELGETVEDIISGKAGDFYVSEPDSIYIANENREFTAFHNKYKTILSDLQVLDDHQIETVAAMVHGLAEISRASKRNETVE